MNIRIAYRGTVEHTKELDDRIRKQLSKIMSFLEKEHGPATVDLVLEGHPDHAHNTVHLHIIAPMLEVIATREEKNIELSLNKVIDIAYESLHKQKERLVHDKKNRGPHRDT